MKKTKLLNKTDQERLLLQFYNDFNNKENDYLGNAFKYENDVYCDVEEISDNHD